MPNGTQTAEVKPKSFLDIASSFPADMSEDTYNAARSKYFNDVIVPKIKPEESIGATWTTFKAQTERPHLLTTAGRAATAAQLGAAAAAKAVLVPMTALDSLSGAVGSGSGGKGAAPGPISGLHSDISIKEDELTKIGDREGLATGVLKGAGSLAGAAVGFEALGAVTGGVAEEIAANFAHGARSLKLLSSTLRGGMAFGTYDALSANDGNRMVEGLKGFGIGAGADLLLSTGGLLARRGVSDAGDLIKRTASGIKPPPEIDAALAKKAVGDAEVARTSGRPNEIKLTNAQHGARVYVTDVSGQTSPIEIKQYKEADAYQQMTNIVRQGGSVSHFEAHVDDQKVLNEFLHLQTFTEEAKQRSTTLRTGNGQAPAVARAANTSGLPAEAVAGDAVQVATTTTSVPRSKQATAPARTTTEATAAPQARTKPTPEEIDAHLENVAPKDKNFVGRSIEKAWDPNIPTSDKQREIQIALKYAPHMLPPEYSEYALPRITNRDSYMFGQVDANEVGDKVRRVGEAALGYPIKVVDVATGENPNRVQVYLKGNVDPAVNDSVKAILSGKLGPAYDIRFSAQPEARRFDILGARSTLPRVLTDDKVQELIDFYDVPEGQVDPDKLSRMTEAQAKTELEAIKSRLEDQSRGERTAEQRPRVTDERKRPDSFLAEKVPDSERSRVQLGDDLHDAVEASSGGRLRERPGSTRLIVPGEQMPGGVSAISTQTQGGPLQIIKEGEVSPEVLYHENLHTNTMHAGAYEDFSPHVADTGTAKDIATGLIKEHDVYRGASLDRMQHEAYVHAATAIRFGDERYLQQLADWDTSVDRVKEFVNATSKSLLQHSIDVSADSIPVRNLQRSVTDLIRRTDPAQSYELAHGVAITGSGSHAWYDPQRGWVLQESPTSSRVFNNINDLWDHLHSNDKNFLSPNYTFMPDRVGVRGGMTPPGAEPNGSLPPNPEVPQGRKQTGFLGLTKWWRPTIPWMADADAAINRMLRSKGINLPIYDSFKDVDDAEAKSVTQRDKWATDSSDILQHFDQKKGYDVAQYLTHSDKERTPALMKQLGLSQEEAIRAHQYDQYLKQFEADTGIDVRGFLQRDYPRLRMYTWDPTGVWGPGISEKNAGFWEKAIRYDQSFNPQDLNLHRFNQFLIRQGVAKNFTAEPLQKLNALIQRVDEQDQHLIPSDIRYGLQQYHDYMKGLPDDSKVSIENAVKNFFSGVNERTAQLNEHLPANVQIPKVVIPPREAINRMILLTYTGGLGLRTAASVRDGLWSLISASTFLGPTRFARAFVESFKPEAWVRAREASALLTRHNIGELLGDVTQEMPTGGKNLFDRMIKWSNMLLAPSRWAHNFGRNIMFNGEYLDALDAVNEYRGSGGFVPRKGAAPGTIDTFFQNTSLSILEPAQQNRLLNMIHDPTKSPHEIAQAFGRDATDASQWAYRRGTQPMALRFTAGRIFGQFGVWPANYVDLMQRTGRLAFTNPKLAARMALMWAATNYSASSAMEAMSVDSSKWFYLSPAGFSGSPHMELVQNLMKAPENTQQGREARRAVLEYPLDFVPGSNLVEGVLKGMSEPGGSDFPPTSRQLIRLLGFKPLDEHVANRSWQDWVRYQSGFPKSRQ